MECVGGKEENAKLSDNPPSEKLHKQNHRCFKTFPLGTSGDFSLAALKIDTPCISSPLRPISACLCLYRGWPDSVPCGALAPVVMT